MTLAPLYIGFIVFHCVGVYVGILLSVKFYWNSLRFIQEFDRRKQLNLPLDGLTPDKSFYEEFYTSWCNPYIFNDRDNIDKTAVIRRSAFMILISPFIGFYISFYICIFVIISMIYYLICYPIWVLLSAFVIVFESFGFTCKEEKTENIVNV
jgi:hypothetical protein